MTSRFWPVRSSAPDHNCCLKLRLAKSEAKSIMCTSRVEAKKNMNMHANYTMIGLVEGLRMLKKSWRKNWECPKLPTNQTTPLHCVLSFEFHLIWTPMPTPSATGLFAAIQMHPLLLDTKTNGRVHRSWTGLSGYYDVVGVAAIEEVEEMFVILCFKASTLWQGQGAV